MIKDYNNTVNYISLKKFGAYRNLFLIAVNNQLHSSSSMYLMYV